MSDHDTIILDADPNILIDPASTQVRITAGFAHSSLRFSVPCTVTCTDVTKQGSFYRLDSITPAQRSGDSDGDGDGDGDGESHSVNLMLDPKGTLLEERNQLRNDRSHFSRELAKGLGQRRDFRAVLWHARHAHKQRLRGIAAEPVALPSASASTPPTDNPCSSSPTTHKDSGTLTITINGVPTQIGFRIALLRGCDPLGRTMGREDFVMRRCLGQGRWSADTRPHWVRWSRYHIEGDGDCHGKAHDDDGDDGGPEDAELHSSAGGGSAGHGSRTRPPEGTVRIDNLTSSGVPILGEIWKAFINRPDAQDMMDAAIWNKREKRRAAHLRDLEREEAVEG